ncbi:MAG: polysaccharide deacetylase family protein, partial [Alphaproteobacteria bacterium]
MPSPYFVTTDFIDASGENYMSWDQLRELSSSGVVIGTLGASYRHLVSLNESEVAADIAQANQHFMDKIGAIPELFAYPFGEYSADLQKIITRYRYSTAFGQHSGVIYPGADYCAFPRYPLVESYSNMARFQTVVDTPPSGDRLGADRPSG